MRAATTIGRRLDFGEIVHHHKKPAWILSGTALARMTRAFTVSPPLANFLSSVPSGKCVSINPPAKVNHAVAVTWETHKRAVHCLYYYSRRNIRGRGEW